MRRNPAATLPLVGLLLAGLLLARPVRAAGNAALVYGPAPEASAEPALSLLRQVVGEADLPTRRIGTDALPIAANPPLVALGADPGRACAPGTVPPAWIDVVAAAEKAINDTDYNQALTLLGPAIDALPCANQVVETRIPAKLFVLRGLALFFSADRDRALASFRAAVALDRNLQWDNNFPPAPRQVFLDAKEDALRAGTARVQVVATPGEVSQLVVDGVSSLEVAYRGVEVLSGFHVLQYRMSDGSFHTSFALIGGGETRLLVTRQGAAEAVLAGARRDEMTYAARAVNSFLCRALGVEQLYVADLGRGEPYLYRFSLSGGRFDRLSVAGTSGAAAELGPQILVEGLLVLPNSIADGAPADTLITVEGNRLQGAVRLYVGDQQAPAFARDGSKATFTAPAGLKPGVYDVRVVYADGKDWVAPLAFSVQADPSRIASLPMNVAYVTVERIIKADRLRIGLRWGMVYFRDDPTYGQWGDLSLDLNVRMGNGFCLGAGAGMYARAEADDPPRGYVFAGFKARWYPRVLQAVLGAQFLYVLGKGEPGMGGVGARGVLGLDIVIPQLSALFFTVEAGAGVMFFPGETSAKPAGWFNVGGGTGVRF